MLRTARLSPALLLVGFAFGCSDYKLFPDKDDENGGRDDTGSTGGGDSGGVIAIGDCSVEADAGAFQGVGDTCETPPEAGFTPVVEWKYAPNAGCTSQPIVADVDGDGAPEVLVNITPFIGNGQLNVFKGDGSGLLWKEATSGKLAYGSPPAVADLDGDGDVEIIGVREYASSLFAVGDYRAVAWDHTGKQLWETGTFEGRDFDWASAPVISDMDHDGSPEIVIGRVILNADGTTRGIGEHGRGSYGQVDLGGFSISESSVPAVMDLDLDGVEEVIVGDAMYSPDGDTLWHDADQEDAMISPANLDDDEFGEYIAMSYNTIRAVDTDGTVMWGPHTLPSANILAPAGIADLDGDGLPEIVTAGGNELVVFRRDGKVFWRAKVTDESGATAASFFDFEGDGSMEVVYIDELQMFVFDGPTGAVKFYSTDHASATMFDYPTIADVDEDGQAEIIVCHQSSDGAVSAYGDIDGTWRPAREVWNQHAYYINNINDDLSVPVNAEPNFTTHNTWHAGTEGDVYTLASDLTAEFVDVCLDACELGSVIVEARAWNLGDEPTDKTVTLALYAQDSAGGNTLLRTREVTASIESGWVSDAELFELDAAEVKDAAGLWLAVDDDGTGLGIINECSEANNGVLFKGPFCD